MSTIGVAQAVSSSNPFSRQQQAQLLGSVSSKTRDRGNDVAWFRDDDRSSSGSSSGSSPGDRATAKPDYDEETGPFTQNEARDLRSVWGKIRQAKDYEDIDWRSVGLSHAPGDRDARDFLARHWDSLRRAERFDDINWRAEYHDEDR
jgi:hypothetical protein